MFVVEVHLAIQASLQALHINPKNLNIKNPNWWGQTSWLFTRMTEELNQALTRNNTSWWPGRDLNPGHRTEIQCPKPLRHYYIHKRRTLKTIVSIQ